MDKCEINKDIPKYCKKKASSTSKSSAKSKHKHEYVPVLFLRKGHPLYSTYCKRCGKIGDLWLSITKKDDNGIYKPLSDDEIFNKFPDLEKIEIEDIWQKYIPI